MLRITKGEISLTETDLRQMLEILENVKSQMEFISSPMPFGDVSSETRKAEELRRGKIRLTSPSNPTEVVIQAIQPDYPQGRCDYKMVAKIPEPVEPTYDCSKCKDTGVINADSSKDGHSKSYVRCDHDFKRPPVEEIKTMMEKDMSKIELPQVSAGENLNSEAIEIKHADLESSSEDSIFKKECPVCGIGMLLVTRDQATLELIERDRCIFCAQTFIYTDIEELKVKAGEGSKNTPKKSKWKSTEKYNILSADEVLKMGLLQEINRQFLHPLGFCMGLPGKIDRIDHCLTFGFWKLKREEDEIVFGEWPICSELIDEDLMKSMEEIRRKRFEQRKKKLGYIIQPSCEICKDRGMIAGDKDCPRGCERL